MGAKRHGLRRAVAREVCVAGEAGYPLSRAWNFLRMIPFSPLRRSADSLRGKVDAGAMAQRGGAAAPQPNQTDDQWDPRSPWSKTRAPALALLPPSCAVTRPGAPLLPQPPLVLVPHLLYLAVGVLLHLALDLGAQSRSGLHGQDRKVKDPSDREIGEVRHSTTPACNASQRGRLWCRVSPGTLDHTLVEPKGQKPRLPATRLCKLLLQGLLLTPQRLLRQRLLRQLGLERRAERDRVGRGEVGPG